MASLPEAEKKTTRTKGIRSDHHSVFEQQARSLVRIASPQRHHLLFQLGRRLRRAVQRTATALGDSCQAGLAIALDPQQSCRTRNPELLTQSTERPLSTRSRYYKPHSLFLDIHSFPGHFGLHSGTRYAR